MRVLSQRTTDLVERRASRKISEHLLHIFRAWSGGQGFLLTLLMSYDVIRLSGAAFEIDVQHFVQSKLCGIACELRRDGSLFVDSSFFRFFRSTFR